MSAMRLQKFLARAGVASRRKCQELIAEGRVTVNGRVAPPEGCLVDPASDEVCFDGAPTSLPDKTVVIMLNKPKGYKSAMSDDRGSKLASDLLPTDEYPGLFHVGRLDVDTEGLLLYTNDGDLGNALLHPSKGVWKRYVATVKGVVDASECRRLEEGVDIEGGITAPARCRVIEADASRGRSVVQLEIHEGRKRQVRLMMKAVGHEVIDLKREAFGPIRLGDLPTGEWRLLTDGEIASLAPPQPS